MTAPFRAFVVDQTADQGFSQMLERTHLDCKTKSSITEIAPDTYRISIYVPEINLQFNHFLVKDEAPLLFHTGLKAMFPLMREAVATLIDPSRLRWIGFSHFESDECGALNQWLEVAPSAEPVCSQVGALVSVNDFALRPARGMVQDEVLTTGTHRFRFCSTAHLPHGWDSGVLFEETTATLLCSDLFFHDGDVEPVTGSDVVGRARKALTDFVGDGEQALRDLAVVLRELLGFPGSGARP